jgi:hypothetical protein
MKLIEINWQPTDRQLKQFGWIALVALPLATWLVTKRPHPSTWSATYLAVFSAMMLLGVLAAVLALVKPRALKHVFVGACVVAFPIGLVISQVVMMLIYFFVFLPVAVWFRIIGRDALHRRFEPDAQTYWQDKFQPSDVRRYFRQS